MDRICIIVVVCVMCLLMVVWGLWVGGMDILFFCCMCDIEEGEDDYCKSEDKNKYFGIGNVLVK